MFCLLMDLQVDYISRLNITIITIILHSFMLFLHMISRITGISCLKIMFITETFFLHVYVLYVPSDHSSRQSCIHSENKDISTLRVFFECVFSDMSQSMILLTLETFTFIIHHLVSRMLSPPQGTTLFDLSGQGDIYLKMLGKIKIKLQFHSN